MATVGSSIVLFGGVTYADGGPAYLSDTWIWDGKTWTTAASTGPSARELAGMAAVSGAGLLFGGDDVSVFGGTWIWAGSAWASSVAPGPYNCLNPLLAGATLE